jgi:hypothetical protein
MKPWLVVLSVLFILPIIQLQSGSTVHAVDTNQALSFNGSTTRATGVAFAGQEGSQTVEAWIRPATNNAYGCVFFTRNDADNQGWLIEMENGQATLWVADGVTDHSIKNTNVTMQGGTWYHVAATYDATTHEGRIYVNGNQGASANLGPISTCDNCLPLRMGGFASFPFFGGMVDEVRVSSGIRYTAAFTPPTAPFTSDASTLVLYHFDEGTGQTAADSSGNGRTMTLGASTAPEAIDPSWVISTAPIADGGASTPPPSLSPTSTQSPTASLTPTQTPTPVASNTASPTATATRTPTPTLTMTKTPTPTSTGTPAVNATIDSTSSEITYDGWWPTKSDASSIGGSERVGEFGGDKATFAFTGSSIQLLFRRDTDRGQALVRIDGVVVGQLDQYGTPLAQSSSRYTVTPGAHTIQVTINRTKQSQSSGYFVGVDAFVVGGG